MKFLEIPGLADEYVLAGRTYNVVCLKTRLKSACRCRDYVSSLTGNTRKKTTSNIANNALIRGVICLGEEGGQINSRYHPGLDSD